MLNLEGKKEDLTLVSVQMRCRHGCWTAVRLTALAAEMLQLSLLRGKRKQVFLELGKALIEQNKKETQGKGTPGPDLG